MYVKKKAGYVDNEYQVVTATERTVRLWVLLLELRKGFYFRQRSVLGFQNCLRAINSSYPCICV